MAIQSLLIIVGVLAVLLVVGVPISYSIGISSLIAILQTVSMDVSVVTGAQRIFVGWASCRERFLSLTSAQMHCLAQFLVRPLQLRQRLAAW